MPKYYLAITETASNQRYIFQSNKLREVLGASELVRRAGETFAQEALEAGNWNGQARRCVFTSGKALALFEHRKDAVEFVRRVTRRALEEAPGLGVFGAVSLEPIADDAKASEAAGAMESLLRRLDANRLRTPAPELRFSHLPPVAPCRTSGLPAEGLWRDPDKNLIEIGTLARAKRLAAKDDPHNGAPTGDTAFARLNEVFGALRICSDPDLLERMNTPWFGVIHIDGNGFGEIFTNLDRFLSLYRPAGPDAPTFRNNAKGLFEFYAALSQALDEVGRKATIAAAEKMKQLTAAAEPGKKAQTALPLVPLVMGGDDLTVIVDGKQAISFARDYVAAFESLVGSDPLLGGLRDERGPLQFGAAAGVAIVKPHHPFHRAYDLADELLKNAKVSKKLFGNAVSCVDFQVLFADTTSDLETLRGKWRLADGTSLTMRPYVLSAAERYQGAAPGAAQWAKRRDFGTLTAAREELERRTKAEEGEETRMALPRSQQHALRDALFEGAVLTMARLALILGRYDVRFKEFGGDDGIFTADLTGWPEAYQGSAAATRLLDAMELNDVAGAPGEEEVSAVNRDDVTGAAA